MRRVVARADSTREPCPCRIRRWGRATLVLALAVATAVVFAPTADAQVALQEKSWTIDSLDILLDVQENGDVLADETFTYSFAGNFHWIERGIPTDAGEGISEIEVRDSEGIRLTEDGTGSSGTFSTYEEGDTIWVRVNFDITDASATYTFHYRTKNIVSFGKDDDALIWYILDTDFDAGVARLQATVRLPGSVPPSEILYDVDADYGVDVEVYSPGTSTLVYRATDLSPYSYVYTRTGFPKGVVTHHWTTRQVLSFIMPKLGFVLPIFTFLIVLLLWFRRGRDEPSRVYAKYVADPPSDLSPGLVGALIDEQVDTKEVMATVIDLARRGYLEIEEGEGKSETTFTRVKPLKGLHGFESTVAHSLFDSSHPDKVTVAQLKNHFYTHVGPIVDQIYTEVTKSGYFRSNPKKVRRAWSAYGVVMIVAPALISYILSRTGVDGWGYFMTGAVFSALIVWVFGRRMPARTAKGSSEQRKWEAFRNYLKDLTRFQDMEAAKEKYEECLPYAIALGVEKQWTRRFEDITVSSPEWYHPPVVLVDTGRTVRPGGLGGGVGGGAGGGIGGGIGGGAKVPGGGFSLGDISDGLFGALGKASSAMTSAPSSASGGKGAWGGGGFGGGGFSGGGFSGGGGGGGMRAG